MKSRIRSWRIWLCQLLNYAPFKRNAEITLPRSMVELHADNAYARPTRPGLSAGALL